MQTYEYHEVANLFPLLEGEEYSALVEDIRKHGQREPIWIHDSKIIDGRNRYRACCDLSIEPYTRRWDGSGSLVEFVISLNLHRRHLTASQKAILALEVLPLLEQEAKERQGTRTDLVQIFAPSDGGKSRDKAAILAGTNRQYVSDAKKIQQESPQLLDKVRTGELTIPEAKRELRLEQKREVWSKPAEPVTSVGNAFGVIYADPPWRYDFSKDNADKIEAHYPTMELSEICGMDVKSIAANDAVLFLWATCPKLQEALAVMSAWGFDYRTNIAWDKETIGMGYYARGQHELLLIGTRGNPGTPLPEARPASVVREKKGAHSRKPDQFYTLIESMYPHLAKVELFCRSPREGWMVWGNEAQ
jgi:N6-adenosine-specific RNA methylase IME4